MIIPVVLAKLWSVIPRLFAWPPARSLAQLLERVTLLMLVGGILFEIVTGILNIQYDYVFGFDFYTAHYFGAWVFIAGFVCHLCLKLPTMVRSLRSRSMRSVLGTSRADTVPEPPDPTGLVALDPDPPTLSRRGALALVGGGTLLVAVLTAGQTVGGFTRSAALLLPRGRSYGNGPNDFQINRTAAPPASIPPPAGPAGVLSCSAPCGPSCWTGPRCRRWSSTPWNCRSPAWKGGRPHKPGPGSGWPIWPLPPGGRAPVRRWWYRWSGSAPSTAPCSRPTRSWTPTRCWRCGSTAPTYRWITATRPPAHPPAANYLRLPTLAGALLLMVFLPGIIQQGAPTYHAATGLTQAPYLTRWLLLTATFCLISAVCYTTKTVLAQQKRGV